MELALPAWFEIGSFIVLLLILAFDLLIVFKRPHIPSPKESTLWVSFYVALALVFALLMFLIGDAEHAGQFLAGWLTEYSLSIDNLFVFVIIMSRFAVPKKYQQEVLMVGIIIALVLRGVFIILGAQLIASFSWIFYIFGAFLLYTAIHQALSKHDDSEGQEDSAFIRFLRTRLKVSNQFEGFKLRTLVDGNRMFTPLIIVFLALGTTDLLFALDSIPAIFGITQSPFIVFAANVFALMGLRQLYFLLGHLLDKLEYLKYGIAFILAFIGVKLVFHAMHENELPFINGGEHISWAPDIGTLTSLVVIIAAMAVATIASLVKLKLSGTSVAAAIHGDGPDDADDSDETGSTPAPARTTREESGP
ncbi:TerC/Alx family metal homeostasis membrane protein [Leifsonia poae]|uniref:TerC/Alx family metal homeostasis membrane protein n=1 Tax=Leifsonia poae TaxID=110933 RepID=UPI001CBE56BA|nr:TerC/Alx family metal homeostasis membrane protein [Leifsonia poae]